MPITMSKGQFKTKKDDTIMGMAASQARLLTITARMHDVEYEAQSIQNAKLALATQSDQVYQKYLEALDATTLTVKNEAGQRVQANFNNLFGPEAVRTTQGASYFFRDSSNKLIVNDSLLDSIQDFEETYSGGSEKEEAYAYAMYMLGIDPDELDAAKESALGSFGDNSNISSLITRNNEIKREIMQYSTEGEEPNLEDWNSIDAEADSAKANKPDASDDIDKLVAEYNKNEETISNFLYVKHPSSMYTAAGGDTEDFDAGQYKFYVELYTLVQQEGGADACTPTSSYDKEGQFGSFENDSDWLKLELEAGRITISEVNMDNKTGQVTENGTAVSSDSSLEYTTTSSIDKTALAKAEAEYEHDTKALDQKDKKFDMDLNKLDTERNALKTEYESVKTVIGDNIERTFGIFS